MGKAIPAHNGPLPVDVPEDHLARPGDLIGRLSLEAEPLRLALVSPEHIAVHGEGRPGADRLPYAKGSKTDHRSQAQRKHR